jgi:GTPase SAR1 family protein
MYLGAKNAGIKFENIVIILNDYNLENKLTKFKEKYNIKQYPNVINYSFYLTASSKHFYYKHKNTDLLNKHIVLNKPYKFLSLNRRLDLHRVKLLSEILNEISFDSIISFDKKLITNEIPLLFEKEPLLKEKFDLLPNKVIADREDIENTNGYEHENENLFLDSYISIVTETSFYIDNDFISEKIWKPLYQFHPFIVVGRPHLLNYLREIGFKTFDWLIDETYDTIEDNDLRMEAIIKEIKKLNKLELDEIQLIIKQNFDKLEHNHTLLNNLGKQTKTIEEFVIEKIKKDNYTYTDIFKEINLHL